METRKQLIMTGVFLTFGIVVILVTIMMLGGDKKLFQKSARIYVKFDQVQGLNQGSLVSLSGLPIGNVDDFIFDPETNKIRVTLKIKDEELAKLPVGTLAEIRTQGALGDKYIYITPGKADSERLKDGAEIDNSKSTDIMAILSEKGNETERIFDIIKEIHILTKTINQDNRVGKIMDHLETGTLALSKVAVSAESSMNKFDRIMTKIDKGEGTLGALISDPSIHDQIKNILGGSQRKSQVKDMLRHSVER
jgi:phospholipid/cholesterol/gamma-HCH transport system substrate-binding protein